MSFYDFVRYAWTFKAAGMRRASFSAPSAPTAPSTAPAAPAAPAGPKMRSTSFGGPSAPKPAGATPQSGQTQSGQDASQWHEIPSMPGRQVRFVNGEKEVRPVPSEGGAQDKPKEEGGAEPKSEEGGSSGAAAKAKLSGGVDELTRGLSGALNARGQQERLRRFNQAKTKVDEMISRHTEGKTDANSKSIKNMLGNIRLDIGELMNRGGRMSEAQRRGKVDNLQRKMSRLRNMDTGGTVAASRNLEVLAEFLHKLVEEINEIEKQEAFSSFESLGDVLE